MWRNKSQVNKRYKSNVKISFNKSHTNVESHNNIDPIMVTSNFNFNNSNIKPNTINDIKINEDNWINNENNIKDSEISQLKEKIKSLNTYIVKFIERKEKLESYCENMKNKILKKNNKIKELNQKININCKNLESLSEKDKTINYLSNQAGIYKIEIKNISNNFKKFKDDNQKKLKEMEISYNISLDYKEKEIQKYKNKFILNKELLQKNETIFENLKLENREMKNKISDKNEKINKLDHLINNNELENLKNQNSLLKNEIQKTQKEFHTISLKYANLEHSYHKNLKINNFLKIKEENEQIRIENSLYKLKLKGYKEKNIDTNDLELEIENIYKRYNLLIKNKDDRIEDLKNLFKIK